MNERTDEQKADVSLYVSEWHGVIGAVLVSHTDHEEYCECDKVAETIARQIGQQR